MSEQTTFQLERFYFGNLIIDDARTSSTTGVVARTPDISPEQVNECVRLAQLRPPLVAEIADDMPGALGLFRGSSKTSDFILAKAQPNTQGIPQVLYILMPVSVLRQLGGNVLTFRSLGMMEMPAFSTVKPDLHTYDIRRAVPPTADEQTDALYDLLLYCKDSFDTVAGLLSGIVQGWPLAIVNSPPVLEKRLQFLQGLLSLLPTPARIGITFATHVIDFEKMQTQIKFATQHAIPPKHIVFDWGSSTLLTQTPEDAYSRYIISQLELDAAVVVQETERMARTAVWRAMHREDLGKALEWVSRRAALDQIVSAMQPADRDMVTAVLHEDPTLPDDLRRIYIRHVLTFALALQEADSADVVAAQCGTYQEMTQTVVDQLTHAINEGQSWLVYTMVERWITHVPEVSAAQWRPLLHNAIKAHLKELVTAGKNTDIVEFLDYLRKAPAALGIRELMSELVRVATPAGHDHSQLAQVLFILAVEFLPSGDLHLLVTDDALMRHMPKPLQLAAAHLQTEPCPMPPPQVLDQGARAFGDGRRMLVLARLVELAVVLRRSDLVDTAALQALQVITQKAQGEHFHTLVNHIIDDLTDEEILRSLAPPGPRIVVQLLLQTGEYEQAIAMLEYYQNTLYGTARLPEFVAMVGELYQLVPLSPENLTEALQHLEGSQLRPASRAMIYASALANRQWADDQEYAAKQLTTIIFNDESLIEIIGRDNVLRLLEFHARPRNALDVIRIAAALVQHTIKMGAEGATLITQMWPLITWDAEITGTSIELLRQFIRGMALREVPSLIDYLTQELDKEIADILRATYIMRFVVEDANLMQFTERVHIAAQLFADIAAVYHATQDPPSSVRLRRDLDTMTGGLSDDDRRQVANNMLTIPRQIYDLHQARIKRGQNSPEDIIQGTITPQNGIELLYFAGGHFAQREKIAISFERKEMAHLLGTRSAAMFLRETDAITRLLQGLIAANKPLATMNLDPKALRAELNSLWDTLSLYQKRQLQAQFASDCQHLAYAMQLMAEAGDERVLGDTNIGRQLENGKRRPQTALENMRWLHGYFARKHR